MAGARGKAKSREGGVAEPNEWRQILPAVSISLGVLGVILLAAMLQSGEPPRQTPAPAVTENHSPPVRTAEPATIPEPNGATSPPPVDPRPGDDLLNLARRVERDEARIASTPSGWTLQFMLACDPANVRARVARLDAEKQFYLLSKFHGERACFRLCWGLFDSREQAVASRQFPAALAAITDRPQPLPVEQALR